MTRPWNSVAEFREEDGGLQPYVWVNGALQRVAWAPLGGSQVEFLDCEELLVLFQGARGATGKTECLHVDFMRMGEGLGPEHRGLFIKPTYPELEDPKAIGHRLIPKIYPGATYNDTKSEWTFPAGWTLSYRPFGEDPLEWNRFHGRNVTWVGIDELANYRSLRPMQLLLSILRSSNPKVRLHMRCTTNTWGPNRDNILAYFHLSPAPAPMYGPLITGDDGPPRRVITGSIWENYPLLMVQPDYISQLCQATKDQPEKMRAWLYGEWTVPPNMFFSNVDWGSVTIPEFMVPTPGRIRLGLDHGITAPSVAVFCWVSKGEDIQFMDGTWRPTVKGDVYVVGEYYGAVRPGVGDGAMPAEIGRRLHAICDKHGWNSRILSAAGNYADTSIFNPSTNDYSASTAKDLERAGCVFEPANKARVLGATQMLKMLLAAKPPDDRPREEPALFITENCVNLLRTLPNMQRADDDPDDVSTEGDDHCYDSLRFFLMREQTPAARIGRIDQIYSGRRQTPRLTI